MKASEGTLCSSVLSRDRDHSQKGSECTCGLFSGILHCHKKVFQSVPLIKSLLHLALICVFILFSNLKKKA